MTHYQRMRVWPVAVKDWMDDAGLTDCLLLFLCLLLLRVTLHYSFSLLSRRKLTFCGPADGIVTPRHSSCCMLFPLPLSPSRSVRIYFICSLFLPVFIFSFPFSNVVPGVLLVLNHNKNKYLSGDISCSMLCLLAVFIAYASHSTVVLSPPPTFLLLLMCFHVLTPCSPPPG